MKITKFVLFGIMGAFLLNSCSSDDDIIQDPIPEGDYTNGFFVLNEGGTGSVTFIGNDLQTVEQEIYSSVNAGDDVGQFAQSMFFADDLAFIISNGSNLVTVVDRYTFELVGKIETALSAPRYGTTVNGKAYITNHAGWETNLDDFITVIDIETLEVENSVIVGDYAESVIEQNGLLYIENAAYGTGNKISVFNPSNNSIESTIEVGDGLNSVEIENNRLYALSSNKLTIVGLPGGEVVSEITFPEGFSGAKNLKVENDNAFYTIGNGVYSIGAGTIAPPEDALIEYETSSEWGKVYGFEVHDDRIYIADGGNFNSNSFVEVYTIEGELLQKITVGVGPNGFYFND